ncbi:50S ribosomal protein L29 [Blattabacterium cuenoti]|uniref:50S ribosomal protein L29 n=1 Tax=Blattabacterium cuenoti TaxID=1653831 RepID=UPI00163BF863|nr:50S ribosomal protein L29 [Blattabacterium cuenoti]
MKYSDIEVLSKKDIKNHIKKQKDNYQKIKFDHVFGLIKNPMEIRIFRKNIAKLKTELNKRRNDS